MSNKIEQSVCNPHYVSFDISQNNFLFNIYLDKFIRLFALFIVE